MTATETLRLLAYIQALWPSFTTPTDPDLFDMTVLAWTDQLAEFTLPESLDAARRLAAGGSDFAPTPGQFRRRLLNVADPGVAATAALGEVRKQIQRVGWCGIPEWSDPAIPLVIEALGGWTTVCESENPEAFRAHFLRLYEPLAARANEDAAARRTPQIAAAPVTAMPDLRLDRDTPC